MRWEAAVGIGLLILAVVLGGLAVTISGTRQVEPTLHLELVNRSGAPVTAAELAGAADAGTQSPHGFIAIADGSQGAILIRGWPRSVSKIVVGDGSRQREITCLSPPHPGFLEFMFQAKVVVEHDGMQCGPTLNVR